MDSRCHPKVSNSHACATANLKDGENGRVRCPVLVGRIPEVALLSDLVRRLTRGDGSTMLLLGEAGIGKTRLVEFASAASERAGVRVVVGRGVPEPLTGPLRPIGEALLE